MLKTTLLLSLSFFLNLVHLNAQVNWTVSNSGLPSSMSIHSFTVQNNAIYALGSFYNGSSFVGKLYKSTDSGVSWTEVSTSGLSTVAYGKSITALNGSLYLAGGISPSSQEYSVFKSQDNGQTWTVSNNGLPLSFGINSFTVQNTTIYASGSFYNGSSFVGKLYKSTDSGANWTEVSTSGLSTVIYGKAITEVNGSLYLAGGISPSSQEYSVFKSQDNGQTWTVSNSGLPLSFAINSFTVQNTTIYALGSFYNGSSFVGKLYKSNDSGANWTEVSTSGLSSLFYGNGILYNNNIFLAAGGVSATSQEYSVFKSTAEMLGDVNFIEKDIELNCYPNPVKEVLYINAKQLVISKIKIINSLGQNVRTINSDFEAISIADLAKGVYILKMETSIGTINKKIIKE